MPSIPDALKKKYFIRRQEEVIQYAAWLQEKNFEELRGLGHKIKGSGAMFGFPELSILGKTIEDAGKNGDFETLEKSLIEFKEWIKNNQK